MPGCLPTSTTCHCPGVDAGVKSTVTKDQGGVSEFGGERLNVTYDQDQGLRKDLQGR